MKKQNAITRYFKPFRLSIVSDLSICAAVILMIVGLSAQAAVVTLIGVCLYMAAMVACGLNNYFIMRKAHKNDPRHKVALTNLLVFAGLFLVGVVGIIGYIVAIQP